MSALAEFLSSDAIRLSSFSGIMEVPFSPPKTISGSDFCISKQIGKLDINLTVPGFPGLVLHATGSASSGGAIVTWTIDEDIHVVVDGFTVTHVKGAIAVGIASQSSSLGTTCQGPTPRAFNVVLTPIPAASSLTFSAGFLSGDLEQIAVSGAAGAPPVAPVPVA